MLYRILGPLEIRTDHGWCPVSAAKWRALLAVLLVRSGQVVPFDLLVDELWGDDAPPARARKLVSGYVFRLRGLLGDAAGRVLVTRPPGYQLLVGPAELDAARFAGLLADGRAALARHDAGRALALLDEALQLWRGPALVDVAHGPLAARESVRLTELRLEAEELRAEAALADGRLPLAAAELRRLTAEYPLREHLWASLMRALWSAGRQAEALDAYARARQVIADELGADPGAEIQHLHHTILNGTPPGSGGPAAGDGAEAVAVPAGPLVVPRQLPAAVAHLAGRRAALDRLTGLASAGTPVVAAIGGTAGVGKTALAVHWAHRAAERFPDGQLYVDLRGFDRAGCRSRRRGRCAGSWTRSGCRPAGCQ